MDIQNEHLIQSFPVPVFCARNNISLGKYYRLRRDGRAPREMDLGGKVLISRQAEVDWQHKCELPDGTTQKKREISLQQKRQAGKNSATSLKHVSRRKKLNR